MKNKSQNLKSYYVNEVSVTVTVVTVKSTVLSNLCCKVFEETYR
jgi:hypothetical protein